MNILLDVRKMEERKMKLHQVPLSLSGRVHRMLLSSVRLGAEFECVAQTEGRDRILGEEHRIQQVLPMLSQMRSNTP